jgi:hypothetical protein
MKEKYKSDLADIRDMMQRSSRFISLDGWSGISVGIIALLGGYLAYRKIFSKLPELDYTPMPLAEGQLEQMIFLAAGTLFLAIAAAIFFTIRNSRNKGQAIWDAQSKRLILNLGIPLLTGGIVCLILLFKGFIAFLAPFTLIFHGLALVNASQYTLKQIRILGILMIVLGLLGMGLLDLGLIFWGIGFGFCHIGYGVIMKWKK